MFHIMVAAQVRHYVVLWSGMKHLKKMQEKLSQHNIANYTPLRHQLAY